MWNILIKRYIIYLKLLLLLLLLLLLFQTSHTWKCLFHKLCTILFHRSECRSQSVGHQLGCLRLRLHSFAFLCLLLANTAVFFFFNHPKGYLSYALAFAALLFNILYYFTGISLLFIFCCWNILKKCYFIYWKRLDLK